MALLVLVSIPEPQGLISYSFYLHIKEQFLKNICPKLFLFFSCKYIVNNNIQKEKMVLPLISSILKLQGLTTFLYQMVIFIKKFGLKIFCVKKQPTVLLYYTKRNDGTICPSFHPRATRINHFYSFYLHIRRIFKKIAPRLIVFFFFST